MELLYPIDSVNKYNLDNNHKTLHPLVSVLDFSKANPRNWGDFETIKFQYGLYCVILKDVKCGDIRYGRHYYDYQAGTLVFFAPGQIMEIENPKTIYQPMGYGLVFHPDLIRGTALAKNINDYTLQTELNQQFILIFPLQNPKKISNWDSHFEDSIKL